MKSDYQIWGGSEVSLNLNQGDMIDIVDVEGNQPCWVFIEDKRGNIDDIKFANDVEILENPDTKLLQNITLEPKTKVVNLFKSDNPANSRTSFEAKQDTKCLIVALGSDMQIDQQNPPTALAISVHSTKLSEVKFKLPEPLAKPKQEIHIDNSTATSYVVQKGEYFQIIDVEGQQCSDFQAFAQSDLDNNQELCIDPTVTRSILCQAPAPGINNKLYNREGKALVEIIHDKVSRHDSFLLACNAKYYDDKGYMGHTNCTDNINSVLLEHNVGPRKFWEAFNLFFNTFVEGSTVVNSDASWSRPGDYVLFKALTDLVCVSTACPDDTTPVNNWQPTDIHVRIYGKNNNFSNAIAFRPTAEAPPIMTQKTGFHSEFSKYTRNFIEYNGYWLADEYTQYGAINEYWACRERAVIMDLSPLRKFEIYGEDAENLMQLVLTRDVRKLAVGQVVYTGICYENGGMIDDGTLFRLCQNNFRWICGSDYSGIWLRELAEKHNMNVWVKSSTNQIHNVAVQGPKSREILSKIIWTKDEQPAIEELKWFKFAIARIGDSDGIPVVVSRTGYTGELGYEVFCHPKDATEVWQAIWQAGEEFQITPLGLSALDMLRIESGLIFAGYEFCDQTDPFEAGIGFTVPLKSKEEDFVGKEALIKRKQSPVRALVGLELNESEVAVHGDGVYVGRQQVGIITSATRSPILKKNIALCRVSVEHSALGNKVEVGKLDGLQKRLDATVVNFPFYDPDKSRVRA